MRRTTPLFAAIPFVVTALLTPVADAANPRLDRGVYAAASPVAMPLHSLAITTNPAALAHQSRLEARFISVFGGARHAVERGAGWGLMVGLPLGRLGLGGAVEHIGDPAPAVPAVPSGGEITRVSAGGGFTIDGWLHLGGALRLHTAQAAPVGLLTTLDVGLQLTPWRWLSVGATVSDFAGQTTYILHPSIAAVVGPQYRTGWAVHLFERRISWSMELGWPNASPLTDVASTIQVKLSDRYTVAAEYRQIRHNAAVTGETDGSDVRVGVLLRVRSGSVCAAVGALRDVPERFSPTPGLMIGAAVGTELQPPLLARALSVLGLSADQAAVVHPAESPRIQPRPADGPLGTKELTDEARRQALGWAPRLVGKAHREARAIALGVLAFSAAMAREDRDAVCKQLADTTLRFDIETTAPAMLVHANMSRAQACEALRTGELGRYVHDFGPSHPHADMATLLARLFALHGSAFMHLPAVQIRAYGKHVAEQPATPPMTCTTYRAARLPRPTGAPQTMRHYAVEVGCAGVAQFGLQLQGNRKTGFFVTKMAIRRTPP